MQLGDRLAKHWDTMISDQLLATIKDGTLKCPNGFRNQKVIMESNPCKEILLYDNYRDGIHPKQFKQEYLAEWNINMSNEKDLTTPHTERAGRDPYNSLRNKVSVSGYGLSGQLTIEDEEATLKINVPGIESNRIQVTRIDSTLRVRVAPEAGATDFNIVTQSSNTEQLELILADYEDIKSVNLALGVLTVTIERNRDIIHYEVE